jgi:hypothetical protein
MKYNKHHDNAKGTEHPWMPVTFALTQPNAAKVCVAGTFNDWHPEAKVKLLKVASLQETVYMADAK